MKQILLLLLPLVCLQGQHSQLTLDTNLTTVSFTLGDVLHTVHGAFRLTKGDLWFDPASSKAGGTLIVSAASGTSGSHARDGRMNKNILESEKYPDITFAPDRIDGKINLSGHSDFKLHGSFAIHGASHELSMAVKADIQSGHVTATADFDLPYVKWGIKDPSTLFLRVNDTVAVEIHAVGELNSL